MSDDTCPHCGHLWDVLADGSRGMRPAGILSVRIHNE